MRKLFAALAFALVLLPPAPAPTRAGTFTFDVQPPFIYFIDVAGAAPVAAGCIDSDGPLNLWAVTHRVADDQLEGYIGTTAKLKDKADRGSVRFSYGARTAASGDIQRLDLDQSGGTGVGTLEGVKAKMRGKAVYALDPDDEEDVAGTSVRFSLKDRTNKSKLALRGEVAAKETQAAGFCSITFDEAGRPVGLRIGGTTRDGRAINLRLGR
jgi:hypothetical protein